MVQARRLKGNWAGKDEAASEMLEMGGHHLRRDCPMREHDEGNSRKVPRLRDQQEAENQQEKSMEAERLGIERSK